MSAEAWVARIAAAVCRAARWPIGFSLALSIVAGAGLILTPSRWPGALLSIVLMLGLAQVYLAIRIEIDRRIFERFAEDPAAAAEFDAALVQVGWAKAKGEAPRAMADRAEGAHAFVKWANLVLALQILLLVVAGWLAR
jgi:hypothetical protein